MRRIISCNWRFDADNLAADCQSMGKALSALGIHSHRRRAKGIVRFVDSRSVPENERPPLAMKNGPAVVRLAPGNYGPKIASYCRPHSVCLQLPFAPWWRPSFGANSAPDFLSVHLCLNRSRDSQANATALDGYYRDGNLMFGNNDAFPNFAA